jgi:hypothetical protein
MDSKAYTMMRTTGFLAGVCLTVAALLLVLDSRESQQPEMVTQATADATAEELSGVLAAIAEQVDVVQAGNESDQTIPLEHESETTDSEPQGGFKAPGTTADGEPQGGFEDSGPDPDQRLNVQAEAQADDSARQDSGDAGTYLFWSPFRSEWSAQGFAGRLTSATQVPVYRVAFSYQDETERLAQIMRIESITGLKLE